MSEVSVVEGGAEDGTPAPDSDENRRQVLYWRLLARLFDSEEQASLESASVAVVEDIGLPVALLDPADCVPEAPLPERIVPAGPARGWSNPAGAVGAGVGTPKPGTSGASF